MKSCRWCGAMLLWMKVRDGETYYCNQEHLIAGQALNKISDSEVSDWVQQVHQGSCSKCGGIGPIDIHSSHEVYSLLLFTRWKSLRNICCRKCGIKAQSLALIFSLFLGWWGFPWGLVMTPIQVIRNLFGLVLPPNASAPTSALVDMGRHELAIQKLSETNALRQS